MSQGARERCGGCRHFAAQPRMLEAALPGLLSMGSADSAVRGDDGLCALHSRYLSAQAHCARFERRRPDAQA